MRAVILAGGLGNRLRPITIVIPKPLVPVGNYSIIEILIRQLRAQGFSRVSISVGYLAPLVEAYCSDGTQWGVSVDYIHEREPLGTAGCLALIEDLTSESVLVVNGDILTDANFASALQSHNPADAATIFANRRRVPVEFGILETDNRGYLAGYTEKPTLHYAVSMGIYVISASTIADFIPRGQPLDMPDLMLSLLAAGRRVRVVETDARWLDLGRMDDLAAAVEVFTADPHVFLPDAG